MCAFKAQHLKTFVSHKHQGWGNAVKGCWRVAPAERQVVEGSTLDLGNVVGAFDRARLAIHFHGELSPWLTPHPHLPRAHQHLASEVNACRLADAEEAHDGDFHCGGKVA